MVKWNLFIIVPLFLLFCVVWVKFSPAAVGCVELTHPELINISLCRSHRSDKTACEPVGQTEPMSIFNELQSTEQHNSARWKSVGSWRQSASVSMVFTGGKVKKRDSLQDFLVVCGVNKKKKKLRASLPISNPALEHCWPWICSSGGNRLRLTAEACL